MYNNIAEAKRKDKTGRCARARDKRKTEIRRKRTSSARRKKRVASNVGSKLEVERE